MLFCIHGHILPTFLKPICCKTSHNLCFCCVFFIPKFFNCSTHCWMTTLNTVYPQHNLLPQASYNNPLCSGCWNCSHPLALLSCLSLSFFAPILTNLFLNYSYWIVPCAHTSSNALLSQDHLLPYVSCWLSIVPCLTQSLVLLFAAMLTSDFSHHASTNSF